MVDEDAVSNVLLGLNETDGVIGSGVVRRDGLIIADELAHEIDTERIGMMSSSLLGSAKNTKDLLELGDLHQVMLESQEGHMIVTELGETAMLVVTVDPDVQDEDTAVLLDIEETGDTLKNLL